MAQIEIITTERFDDSNVNLYFLPGMGADKSLYDNMKFQKANHFYVEWFDAAPFNDMHDLAKKVCSKIETENNIYIGSSMGGMCAIEMNKVKPADQLILLSAPVVDKEFPLWMKMCRTFRLNKLVSAKMAAKGARFADLFMGFSNSEHRAKFYAMLNGYGEEFLYYALNATLGWKNRELPLNFVQVVGKNDSLFKPSKMKDPIVLDKGGHFSTYENGKEIKAIIEPFIFGDSLK